MTTAPGTGSGLPSPEMFDGSLISGSGIEAAKAPIISNTSSSLSALSQNVQVPGAMSEAMSAGMNVSPNISGIVNGTVVGIVGLLGLKFMWDGMKTMVGSPPNYIKNITGTA